MATRRTFLKTASLAAAGSPFGLNPFSEWSALAQSASSGGYKALVCIFLTGGNDANSLLIPADAAGYANYARMRGPLAIGRNGLLELPGPSSLALNAALPNLYSLFEKKSAAFVANVGTLVQPLSRAQYLAGSASAPSNLFSHADQQAAWQAGDTLAANTGWAGRIADQLTPTTSSRIPISLSVAGTALFGNGAVTNCINVTPGQSIAEACSERGACAGRTSARQRILSFDTGLTLAEADRTLMAQAAQYGQELSAALNSIQPLTVSFPTGNPLAAQLQQICQIMAARGDLGATRQIFFASLGSFDTHTQQMHTQNALLGQLDAALAAFQQALMSMGLENDVTSFTMSEFGRALEPNTDLGSDHGWGTHTMVFGGAVRGGQVIGTYPELELGGPDDAGANGRWIPTTAVSQMGATLASWFGVPDGEVQAIFPTLENFAQQRLAFL